MSDGIISRRGVYYDLSASPWEYESPHGDLFKFRSRNKRDVYAKRVSGKIEQIQKAIDRYDLRDFLTEEMIAEIERAVYRSCYRYVER